MVEFHINPEAHVVQLSLLQFVGHVVPETSQVSTGLVVVSVTPFPQVF